MAPVASKRAEKGRDQHEARKHQRQEISSDGQPPGRMPKLPLANRPRANTALMEPVPQ